MFKYNTDKCYPFFYIEEILPSGNTIRIEFQEECVEKTYYYGIYLVTTHKAKSINNTVLKSTGRDGLLGLKWAQSKVSEFESFILNHLTKPEKIIIYCSWDDNRRRNVYEYGLKPLGYNFNKLYAKKVLMKVIYGE